MWEYRRVEFKFKSNNEINEELNKNGNDGWEAIYYYEIKPEKFGNDYTSIVIYKRLKE